MCHDARRNSPSVADCRPTSSWSFTTSRIASSSMARSSSAVILSLAKSSRACSSSGGRRRLPTWSARYGGVLRADMPGTLPRPQFLQRRARAQEQQADPDDGEHGGRARCRRPAPGRANGITIDRVDAAAVVADWLVPAPRRRRTRRAPATSRPRAPAGSRARAARRPATGSSGRASPRGTPVATSARIRPAPRDDPLGDASTSSPRPRSPCRPRSPRRRGRASRSRSRCRTAAVARLGREVGVQPRADGDRAGAEDHAREQRRERPAARPRVGHQAPRGEQRGRPAREAVQHAPGDEREPAGRRARRRSMPIAPPTTGSTQPGSVAEQCLGGSNSANAAQRRDDQQRRPRPRRTGARCAARRRTA